MSKQFDQTFKADAGKSNPTLLLDGPMGRALALVNRVLDYGAQKYEAHSWVTVPDAEQRYRAALQRHYRATALGELRDAESNLLHEAHMATNALFLVELRIRALARSTPFDYLLKFNQPPTDHKKD